MNDDFWARQRKIELCIFCLGLVVGFVIGFVVAARAFL